MPHAVTHVLVAIIVADIFRDYIAKNKRKFPLHYVLIAGIAGLLPDIDILVYWFMKLFLNMPVTEVHRTFTHTIFIPLAFIILGILTTNVKWKFLSKHKLKLNYVFYFIALGTLVHFVLDALLIGYVMPLYPFSTFSFGVNLLAIPLFEGTILPAVDAIILVLWLIHLEMVHKISDFI